MKTIKELSEALGVSKVAISKKIEKNNLKEKLIKEGNTFFIDEEVEQIIRELFSGKEKKAERPSSSESDNITSEVIELLRAELQEKDKLIDRLQGQIESLQADNREVIKALREVNTLHAGTMAQLENKEQPEEIASSSEPEKRGLFFKLFR